MILYSISNILHYCWETSRYWLWFFFKSQSLFVSIPLFVVCVSLPPMFVHLHFRLSLLVFYFSITLNLRELKTEINCDSLLNVWKCTMLFFFLYVSLLRLAFCKNLGVSECNQSSFNLISSVFLFLTTFFGQHLILVWRKKSYYLFSIELNVIVKISMDRYNERKFKGSTRWRFCRLFKRSTWVWRFNSIHPMG